MATKVDQSRIKKRPSSADNPKKQHARKVFGRALGLNFTGRPGVYKGKKTRFHTMDGF